MWWNDDMRIKQIASNENCYKGLLVAACGQVWVSVTFAAWWNASLNVILQWTSILWLSIYWHSNWGAIKLWIIVQHPGSAIKPMKTILLLPCEIFFERRTCIRLTSRTSHQWPHHSCCLSWTSVHNHHCPSKWTRSSSPASRARYSVSHNRLLAQHDPSHQSRFLWI